MARIPNNELDRLKKGIFAQRPKRSIFVIQITEGVLTC